MRIPIWPMLVLPIAFATSCHKNVPPAQPTVSDQRLTRVQSVLDGIAGTPGGGVPDTVLNHARCIAIFPAGEATRPGTVSCRQKDGGWQKPIAVRFSGRPVPVEDDLLVFLLNEASEKAVNSGALELQDTAAGPVSRVAAVVAPMELRTASVGYERAKSELNGVKLEGEIRPDPAANLPSDNTGYDRSFISFFNTITPNGIILHHTALLPRQEKLPASAAEIDEYHSSRGMDIECFGKEYHVAYHYLVLADGTVQQGRPERCEGAHAPGYNSYLGISVVGDFSSKDNPKGKRGPIKPTPNQIEALVALCRRLRELYDIPLQHILRHSDVAPTKCPGDRFPFRTVMSAIARGSKIDPADPTTPTVKRMPKVRGADEPFATFRMIDRQMSALQEQSSAIKTKLSAKSADSRGVQASARLMRTSTIAIGKLALRLRTRYRTRPYAVRLLKRLQIRAEEVNSALRPAVRVDEITAAKKAMVEVDRRMVALSLQYDAISGGYGALHCEAGESTCCEPKHSNSGAQKSSADACRWMCTPKKSACRGFLGPSLEDESPFDAK